jgi:hypothetical protein
MVGEIGFFTGTVFLGMFMIIYIVKYREECRERVEQVKTLAKIIERLRDKTDYDENGKEIKVNGEKYSSIIKDMNLECNDHLKTRKLDFFWPNLNDMHAYYWFLFWVIFGFLYDMVVSHF